MRTAFLALAAAPVLGIAVPLPVDAPKGDFVGGPFDGLLTELRGEKINAPPAPVLKALDALFAFGDGETVLEPNDLATSNATHSFKGNQFPSVKWQGRIERGFLKKFEGCEHTLPWLDGQDSNRVRVHFYWSCAKQHPYIVRTNVSFIDGKVDRWEAYDLVFPPAYKSSADRNSNTHLRPTTHG